MKKPAAADTSLTENFEFHIIGDAAMPFFGYISTDDPTDLTPRALIRGSQNVYKKSNGNIANRPGLKRRGAADATNAGVKSAFEWETSLGTTRVLHAVNNKLQVEFDAGDGQGNVWRDLMTGLTDDDMLFSFAAWYDTTLGKDELIFVNGDQEINMWSGGMGTVGSTTINTLTVAGTQSTTQLGFASSGSLFINGNVYTYSAAGVLPNIVYTQSPTDTFQTLTTQWVSQLFTTGPASTGIISASFFMYAAAISHTVNATFNLAIYTDNAGVPGTLVGSATGTSPAPFSSGVHVQANFTSLVTTPNTNYHLVVSGLTMPVTVGVYIGVTGSLGTNVSSNGGASWTPSNGYMNAIVTENIVSLTQTLVGVSPDPSAEPAGSVIIQKTTQTDTSANSATTLAQLEANFTNDAIAVVGNQVHLICYTSRLIHVSSDLHYDHYDVALLASGVLRTPGFPDLLVLDSPARGVGAQKGDAVIFGSEGDSYLVHRTASIYNQDNGSGANTAYAYEQVTVSKEQSSDLSSPLGQDFITSVGDTLLFLDAGKQLRQYGTLRNIVTPVYPILSLDVYDELAAVDFTGGHIRAVAEQSSETVYMTSPLTGLTYIYQIRQKIDDEGNLRAERIWQPPFIWSISRIALISGISYGHSSANPQLYQLWSTAQWHDDSPADESLSYRCVQRMAYRNGGKRWWQCRFDKEYVEGYIAPGTDLNGRVYLDYQGATEILDIMINNVEEKVTVPTYISQYAPALGDKSLGDDPLGDGLFPDQNNNDILPKYRTIIGLEEQDSFEYSLEINSEQVDARWETVCLGVNHILAPLVPDEIVQ